MNKVSDKLVPKELAPFLPLASAFIPGLGLGGIFSGLGANPAMAEMLARYAAPQLTTALSSAKMTGEVDPKLQALAGVQSFLQGPVKQTAAEKALLEDKELMKQLRMSDVEAGKTVITDSQELKQLTDTGNIEGLNPFQGPGISKGIDLSPFQPGDMFGPDEIFSFDTGDGMRYFKPGSAELNEYLKTAGTAPDFSKLTGDALKEKLVGGTSLTNKTFDTRFGKLQDTLGKQQGLQAVNKARSFFDSPIGFNKATMAKAGLGATPYLANQAAIYKDELEQEEADRLAQADDFDNARSDLSTYFSRLADPNNRFGTYEYQGGYADGGRIGAKDGRFFGSEFLGANQYDQGPTDVMGSSQMMPMTDEEYSLSRDGFAVDPDEMKELGIGGLLKRLFSGSGTRSLINAFTGGDMDRENLGKDTNMGGLAGTRTNYNMGGMGSIPQTQTVPQGMQLNGQGGGFIPMGAQEKKDDVPAMLAKNEFVMTSDAVRAAGGGSIEKGAQRMYDMMNNLEAQA